MKKLNIAISTLSIMFTANCIGMECAGIPASKQENSHKAIIGKNASLKNIMNQDNLDLTASKEQIDNNNVSLSKFTVLLNYINSGKLEEFKELLKNQPGLKLRVDSEGNDILMIAAYYGREKFIKFLLSNETPYNMNISHINNKSENALLIAASKNYTNIVKLLIEKDPNIMQNTENWKPAFIQACENKKWEIAEYFLNKFEPKKFEPKEGERKKQRYKVQVKCFLEDLLDSIEELKDDSYNCKEIIKLIKTKEENI